MSGFKETVTIPKVAVPKGMATIQLFDENGKLVQEQKKNNYVHPSVLEAVSRATNYYPFQVKHDVDTYGNAGSINMPQYHVFSKALVEGIILTDNSSPANPAVDRYVEGNIIGFASKDITGANTVKRGTYNRLESIHKIDYHKWVFDFATTEANGIFNSIYTGKFNARDATERPSCYPSSLMQFNYPYYQGYAKAYGDNLYILDNNRYLLHVFPLKELKFYWEDIFSKGIHQTYDLTGLFRNTNSKCTAYTFKGDRIYYRESSTWQDVDNNNVSTGGIYSAPLTNPTDIRLDYKLTAKMYYDLGVNTYSYSWVSGLAYNPSMDAFLMGFSYNYYKDDGIYVLDAKTGQIVEIIGKGENLHFSHYSEVSKYNPDLYISGDYIMNLKEKRIEQYIYAFGRGGYVIEVSDVFSLYVCDVNDNDYPYFYVIPSPQFFSRVVLDSPVEKTSRNTMKIIYEFTHDEFTFF